MNYLTHQLLNAEEINQIKKDLESINDTIGKFILGGVKSFSRALAESVVLGKKLKMSF